MMKTYLENEIKKVAYDIGRLRDELSNARYYQTEAAERGDEDGFDLFETTIERIEADLMEQKALYRIWKKGCDTWSKKESHRFWLYFFRHFICWRHWDCCWVSADTVIPKRASGCRRSLQARRTAPYGRLLAFCLMGWRLGKH